MSFWQKYKWILTWIGLISLWSWPLCSSGTDRALALADSLFASQSYQEAITEYKRFIFFHPQSERTSYAFYKIGLSYRAQQQWQEAFQALKNSIETAQNDSVKDERKITLAVTEIASAHYDPALIQLLRVSHFSRFPSLRQKALFFQGVAYVYKFDWANAKEAFSQFYSLGEKSPEIQRIDSLLTSTQYLSYKSPRVAKQLSTFLPGSGQIYAKHWRDGINALLINAFTTTLMVRAIVKKHYWDISTIFFSLFERYYLGNRKNAAADAIEYNQQLNRNLAQKVLHTLLKIHTKHL